MRLNGTQGYSQEAPDLLRTYETITFDQSQGCVLRLLPKPPCRLLDVGAGTGRDAAGFAVLGYEVVAVEPTDEMREGARKLHSDVPVEWLDDGLPDLAVLRARGDRFAVIMMTAVWMHLDETERRRAMPSVVSLLQPAGILVMSLRYGPIPPGRRMFEVSTEETTALARRSGLESVVVEDAPTLLKRAAPVTWKRLAFRRP
jgi:SAM-dependent methyltransferase